MNWCSDKGLPHSELLSWDVEDRAKLHAHLLEEASRCSMCGTQPWEWEENKHAYHPVERFCHGCYMKAMASEDSDSLKGTTIALVPAATYDPQGDRLRYEQRLREQQRAREK